MVKNVAILMKYPIDEKLRTPYVGNDVEIAWPLTKFGKSLDTLLKKNDFELKEKGFDSEAIRELSENHCTVIGRLKRKYVNTKKSIKIEYLHNIVLKNEPYDPLVYLTMMLKGNKDKNNVKWLNNLDFSIGEKDFHKLYTTDELGYISFGLDTKESGLWISSDDEVSYGILANVSENELSKFLLKKDDNYEIDSNEKFHIDAFPITRENTQNYILDVVSNFTKD